MISFVDFYLLEKTISLQEPIETHEDKACILYGQKLAKRFDLILNGWQEIVFYFTIPKGFPNERNTFTAQNEKELVDKLKERFPDYFKYIMQKNFPNGYRPDSSLPSYPPKECEPNDYYRTNPKDN